MNLKFKTTYGNECGTKGRSKPTSDNDICAYLKQRKKNIMLYQINNILNKLQK